MADEEERERKRFAITAVGSCFSFIFLGTGTRHETVVHVREANGTDIGTGKRDIHFETVMN